MDVKDLFSAYPLHLFLLHHREPLDRVVLVEPRDPLACRECPESGEELAFLDPKETE